MGIDVSIRTRKREESCRSKLSRRFCNFLCGPNAYENSEFKQVEDILQINLELLVNLPDTPDWFEIESEIYSSEKRNDLQRMNHFKNLLKVRQEEWQNGLYGSDDSWIKVEELRQLTVVFREEIIANSNYYRKIKYNFSWEDYFLPVRKPVSYPKSYDEFPDEMKVLLHSRGNILLEDLSEILVYLDCVESKGHQLVTFTYG